MDKKIGKYKLEEEIGRGGMGIVYSGMDEDLNRKVAVKMLPKEFFSNEEQKKRFLQEARIVAKLGHPNIMDVYAIEYAEETVWIVMEFLEGKLLSDLIKEKTRIPSQEAFLILMQLIKALAYAHSKGIIHRDLKPANVMISNDGRVKLMDFGIARDESANLNLTQEGKIIGTPKYMSPEQLTGQPIDNRSDIYSLGIMAYEMVSGDVPFNGRTFAEIAYKHFHEPVPALKKKVPAIPAGLERLISQFLQKQKEKRPVNLSDLPVLEFDSETVTLDTIQGFKRVRFYKFAVFYLFILSIIGGIFFYFRYEQKQKEKKEKAAALFSEAREYLDKDDIMKAKAFLVEASTLDPSHTGIQAELEKAEQKLRFIQNKSKSEALFADALKSLNSGDEKRFEDKIREASQLNPELEKKGKEQFQAYLERKGARLYSEALTFLNKGDQEGFEKKWKEAVKLKPDLEKEGLKDLQTYHERRAGDLFSEALVFLNNDKEKEFEDKMKEVIQTCPEKKDEFEARAKTELDAYRERKATAMFSQGLKVLLDENPENYHKNKEVYEQTLRESVSLYPPKKEEFEKKGSEEFHSYQKRIAKKHFEKAIQWAGENNWEKSNAELHKCLEFESGDFQIYNELANNSWEMNQGAVSDEYVRYLEKSLELNPKQEKCWSDLYKAYNELQKTDQANDACARGLKYFPDSQELNNFSR